MTLGRREFLAGASALAVSARSALAAVQPAKPGAIFPASVRADFPSASLETYMNSAAMHPLGTSPRAAIEQGVAYRLHGAGPGRVDFGADKQEDLKKQYGQLINATANEIAYTANTSDGENIVVMGLDLREDAAATSSSTSCTSRRRSTCTRSSRRKASSSASSSTATGRSTPEDMDQGDRQEHAAGVAGAGVERQRLHARCEGGERARARARGAMCLPTSSRRSARCRSTSRRSASTSPRPAPTSG